MDMDVTASATVRDMCLCACLIRGRVTSPLLRKGFVARGVAATLVDFPAHLCNAAAPTPWHLAVLRGRVANLEDGRLALASGLNKHPGQVLCGS